MKLMEHITANEHLHIALSIVAGVLFLLSLVFTISFITTYRDEIRRDLRKIWPGIKSFFAALHGLCREIRRIFHSHSFEIVQANIVMKQVGHGSQPAALNHCKGCGETRLERIIT